MIGWTDGLSFVNRHGLHSGQRGNRRCMTATAGSDWNVNSLILIKLKAFHNKFP